MKQIISFLITVVLVIFFILVCIAMAPGALMADNFAAGEKIEVEDLQREEVEVLMNVGVEYDTSCFAGFQTIPENLIGYVNPEQWRKERPDLVQEIGIEIKFSKGCDVEIVVDLTKDGKESPSSVFSEIVVEGVRLKLLKEYFYFESSELSTEFEMNFLTIWIVVK